MISDEDRGSESESHQPNLRNLAPQELQKQSSHQNQIQQPQKLLTVVKEAKPRLIIQKIILENFKSYADRQVIGPFHQNFTSIVGPNGSGKSNLIESMLFIFGFNASWMRLHRLNQLIHNSATMSNVSKAGVQVHFRKVLDDNSGIVVDIPGSEFIVRRQVNTNSTSKYFLDNKQTTQAQIKVRLMEEGIDLNNNRFLILQGQVEQISQMKQKSGDRDHPGLLEYLEDIIGSNQYLARIQSAIVEYSQVEEIKHQKGQMMRLVETQLKNISKGKEQAIKYVKKEKKIYQIQNVLSQVVIQNHGNILKEMAAKLQHYQSQKERIIQQERQRMKKQAERVKEIKKNKQQIEIIQKTIAKEKEALEKYSISDKNINQQISFKSEDSVKYARKLAELDKELTKIIEESENIKNSLPKMNNQLKQRGTDLETIQKQLSHHDKPHLREKIKQLESQIRKTELQLQTFKEKYHLLLKKTQKMNQITSSNSTKNQQTKQKLAKTQIYFKKISLAQIEAQKKYYNMKDHHNRLNDQKLRVKDQIQRTQLSLRQFQTQNQQFGQRSNMFQQIMKQKIPGVLGRLGDLGKTTRDFDQIITTACAKLDHIVVTSFQAAQAVIEFLKRSKLGRVSCIILDKISQYGSYMRKNFIPLKNAVRLFDMIQPVSDQAKIAFYFAIGDTLYCQDSNLGLEYALGDDRNRKRVISRRRNGYIIYNPNGLMNGCPPKRGGFDNKASIFKKDNNQKQANQLQELKRKLQIQYEQIDKKSKHLENDLREVERDIQQMKKQKQSLQHNINELKQQVKQYSIIVETQSQKQQSDNFNRMKIELSSLDKQIKNLQNIKKSFEIDLISVQEEQNKAQSETIRLLRQKYKINKSQYQKIQKEVEKKKAFLLSIVKSVQENKKQKEQTRKKMNRLQQEITKLKAQQTQIQNKATQIFGRVAASQQKIKQCQQLDKRLRIILQDDQKQVRQSKKKIDQAKHQVDICRQQYKRHESIVANAKEQLKKTRQTYEQLSVTYDFIDQIDQIQKMTLNDQRPPQQGNNASFLETSTILNNSIDGTTTKIFSLDKLLQTSPFTDVSVQIIQHYMLFEDKLRSSMLSEMQSLNKLEGNNLSVITQFKNKYKDYKEKTNEFEIVKQKQIDLKKQIDQLKEKRLSLFREGFGIINAKLKEVYQLLTRGGDAELELIDSLDPFSDGINFSVRPPKKSWKEINKLSGGQKTLSSLSLIFALHYYKPTPLYFMDQIDAALDFKNVSIVAEYIKKRTKDAQFIIISLRNNMFDLADKLVGVYKTHDKTKVIIFSPNRYRALKQQSRKDKENQNSNLV